MNNKQICTSLLVFLFLLIFAETLDAQFNDYKRKFGIQVNGLIPKTEFEGSKAQVGATYEPSYLGRLFLRFNLSKNYLEAELGAGYGILTGYDFDKNLNKWETALLPLDFRLIFSPLNSNIIDAFGYIGIGFLNWNVKTKPSSIGPKLTKETGSTIFIPFGLAFDIKLSDTKFLEITGGYSHTYSDDINYYNNIDAYSSEGTSNDGYIHFGVALVFVGGSGSGDYDLDLLTNNEEKELGTDPNNEDTDGDGLKDGEEVKTYLTNPLNTDSDGDGLSDGDEVIKYKTNPNKVDTDEDGLLDGEEINKYFTNPVDEDSDEDNLTDGDEVLKYSTDPQKYDTDGDGLSDSDEILRYKTDPLKADTDGDGLIDYDEITLLKTNPLNPDSDGDTLSDSDEINVFKTDPLKADTDGGSVKDFIEILKGTNPLDPEDDVIKIADDDIKINVPIVLEGITFAKQKADITPESEMVLLSTLKTLQTYPEISILIGGHTDNVGDNISNQILSQRRAESVKSWLVSKGIDPSKITAVGFGEEKPRVANTTEENKRLNRRVEITRIK